MIALRIAFIAGRFHATPWDRAVNEGEVEWPPAPWRLLRAIVSGWFQAQALDRAILARVIDALAELPRYQLPPTRHAHTRHYMPLGTYKKGRQETTLVLDSFVVFDEADRTEAYVIWDNANLAHEDVEALRSWVRQISYIGRAESWCEVSIVDEAESLASGGGWIVVDLASRSVERGPSVQRLAADAGVRGNMLLRSLFEATGEMRRSLRRIPIGATFVDYRFGPDYGIGPRLRTEPSTHASRPPSVERFLVEAKEPRGLRPSVYDTLRLGDRMRSAAMKRYSILCSGSPAPPILSGKEDGLPARNHAHAYFLPKDLDSDGRIDHIDVLARYGVSNDVARALRDIRQLWSPDWLVAVTYLGPADLPESTAWTSSTPFLPPRHMKKATLRAGSEACADWVRDQIRLELRNHSLTQPSRIEVHQSRPFILRNQRAGVTRFDQFVQTRKAYSARRDEHGFSATLFFDEAVSGPIAIGREAHFGLGQFVPQL